MKPGLSGYIPVRNGFRLDYCWMEAVQSLLPICNEVILCDSDSDDGTREAMEAWAASEPKIRVINRPWPVLPTFEDWRTDRKDRPNGDPVMLVKWLNFIRGHCRYDRQITLDADEVLCPKSYPEIRRAIQDGVPRWFSRINFWQDAQHEAPHGTVCGERVARLGPSTYDMCSDEPRESEPEIRSKAEFNDTLRIFHFGFLRRPQAFFDKSKVMQCALHNTYDPRLVEAEKTGKNWMTLSPFPPDRPLLDYPYHDLPEYCRTWLIARGFKC